MFSGTPRDLFSTVFRYWCDRRDGRAMPVRADIDPAELKRVLPYLMLIQAEGLHFRYRLVGTQAVADMGRDPTGTVFGTHVTTNRFATDLIDQMCRVRDQGAVLFTTGIYRTPGGCSHATARLLLPLGTGQDVHMILQARAARHPETGGKAIDWLGSAQGIVLDAWEIDTAAVLGRLAAEWFDSSIEREPPPQEFPLLSRRAERSC